MNIDLTSNCVSYFPYRGNVNHLSVLLGPLSVPEWQRSHFSDVDMGSNEDSSGNESGEEQYALMQPFGPQQVRNNRERAHELEEMNMKR